MKSSSLSLRFLPLRWIVGVTGLFLSILFTASAFGQTATITTDRQDYQPGDTVIVTGTGWQPGETVKLEFDDGHEHGIHVLYAIADEEGNILNNEFLVEESHLGVVFTLTATGTESGWTAQAWFTDANITITSNTNWSAITSGSGPGGQPSSSDAIIVQGGATLTVDVADGQCASVTLNSGQNSSTATLLFNNGSQLTVSGNVTVGTTGGTNRNGTIDMSAGGTLKIGGALTLTSGRSTFTPGTGTVEYNGSSTQMITATTYNHLKVSGSGAKSTSGVITVNGNFISDAGSTVNTGNSWNVGGNWTVDGTFNQTGGITTFTGGGTHTFSGSGSSQFNNLTTSGQTINAGSHDIRIGADWTHGTSGVFNEQTSTVTLNGSGAQSIPSTAFVPSFFNLKINKSGGSLSTTRVWTVTNNFDLTNGSLTVASNSSFKNFTIGSGGTFTAPSGNINISGNWLNNGTFNPGTGTVTLNGTAPQTMSGTVFNNLTINNAAGVTLLSDETVNGTLTLANGVVTTGSNTLTIGASGTISGGSSSSYISGKLARVYNTTGAKAFPIGKGGNFRPMNFNYTALTGTSTVTAEQFQSGFPGTPPTGTAQVGTRYWNVTQTGGSSFTYSITLDGTGLSFSGSPRILKRDGGTTVALVTTTPNYTATGLTSLSDFAFGEVTTIATSTSASNATTTYGSTSVSLSATVSPDPGGGSVEFFVNGTSVGTAAVGSGGVATLGYNPSSLNAGSYTIKANFGGNGVYLASSSDPGSNGTLTVNARPITVSADHKTKVYGDADPALTYTITSGSLVGSDTFTGSLSRDPGENVGSYAITQGTLSAGSNYTLTFVGHDLEITARPITVSADHKTKVYGDADPALTYTITSGSLVGSDTFTGSLSRDPGESVGSYAITQGTLSAGSNYTLTFVGHDLEITARPITVSADHKTKVYGDADPALTYTITSGSLVGSDTFTGSLSRDPGESVGSYAITQGTLSAGSNYTLTFVSHDLVITPATLTVTPNSGQTKVYGQADPVLTYTASGFQFSDNYSVFTGALSRAAGENVGTYAITLGTLSAGSNYTISFTSGVLFSITPAPTTTSVTDVTATYSSTSQTITVTANVSGSIVNEGMVTFTVKDGLNNTVGSSVTYPVASGVASGSYTLPGGTLVGNYTINASFTPVLNYQSSGGTGNLTINLASTSISVAAASVQYSDQVTLTATVSSPSGQAELEATGGTVTFKIQKNSDPVITLGSVSFSSGNSVSATYTIMQAPAVYKVIAEFVPNSSNLSGSTNSNTGPLTVTKENATAEYTGPTYFSTSSSTSNTAKITLSATIKDVDDGYRGNISNATVEFRDGGPLGPVLGSGPVGLVSQGDQTVGTATASDITISLTSSEMSSGGKSITVYTVVNGYYDGLSDPEVITISPPAKDNVSGGGYLVLQNSNGEFKGSTGSKNNFGYTMKYNKSGKNLQGQANIIVRNKETGKIYQIKSNAINSLATKTTTSGKAASFTTKANMKDITDPLNPIDLGGNLTLQVDMTDAATDMIGITLWNSNGGLYYSSNWNGTKTLEQALGGGNVSVLSGALAKGFAGLDVAEDFLPDEFGLFQNYPNPFNPETRIRFDIPEVSDVKLMVYDLLGRQIATLFDGELEPGRFERTWDGRDASGVRLSSGVYFFRIEAASKVSEERFVALKKMILLK